MPRDLLFFFFVLTFLATSSDGFFPSEAIGQSVQADRSETATYKKALDTFGGPTVVTMALSPRSDLGVWNSPEVQTETGIVLDWNETKLVILRPTSDEPISISTQLVYKIEHRFKNKTAQQLHENYLAKKFPEVVALASKVLGSKTEGNQMARWEQKLVLAMVVESCKCNKQWEIACKLFESLAKESPPPLLAACIPLPWFDSTAEVRGRDNIRDLALKWLDDPNQFMQLIGAAWLLDGDKRQLGVAKLKSLAQKSSANIISDYATAQLWRTIPQKEFVEERFSSSVEARDSMFVATQAGPTLLLAERAGKFGAIDLALGEWLRILTIHRDQFSLADYALDSSLATLKSANRLEDAAKVEALAKKRYP